MSNDSKFFTFALIMVLLFGNIFMWSLSLESERKADQYKSQLKERDAQLVETQLKYEEEKGIKEHIGRDLADAEERLSAAAERERAAKVRASRSRSSRSSAVDAREKSRVGISGGPFYPAGLHDVTKYCPTGNTTASGKQPRVGMVATISRSIPFGTHVFIEGLGEFVVEDRIGHGSEFDIFTNSCAEANRFGRQHRRVTIMDTD